MSEEEEVRVFGFDHQGEKIWDHKPQDMFERKGKPINLVESHKQDLEVAHIIITSRGEILKDRGCCSLKKEAVQPSQPG